MAIRARIDNTLKKFEKSLTTLNNITVSRSAILHNFDYFQGIYPTGFVIPVLKSNAYGHGLSVVATILKERKFPYIAVDGVYESLTIHNVSKQPVLVMGAIHPDNFSRMVFKRLAVVIHDEPTVIALGNLQKNIRVHIELETGMGRHGVSAGKLPSFLRLLAKYPLLELEGIMTHLADADNPKSDMFNDKQTKLFDEGVESVLQAGFKPKYVHIAQSAGSTKVISRYANAMRIGIALYGISPLSKEDKNYKKLDNTRPALTLTSTVTKIVNLEAGDSVSYGRTFITDKPIRIGVMPLGYYEGLPRALSNTGLVEYHNEYLPIAGRVCMNHTMVRLDDADIKVGNEVTVISPNKRSKVSVANICNTYGLFNYGLLVGLNQNVRRKIID